jgi:hypothetical protein
VVSIDKTSEVLKVELNFMKISLSGEQKQSKMKLFFINNFLFSFLYYFYFNINMFPISFVTNPTGLKVGVLQMEWFGE